MNYLKKIGISFLYIVIPILVLTLFTTILHYFGIISKGILAILEIVIPSIAFFMGGFQIGKRSKQKGWLEGIKFSIILFLVLLILNLIFNNPLEIKNALYYLILFALCTIGSMMGINKK